MDKTLTLNETRVIGCLLEKESTTPDLYPLTLNALKAACNQKSNREPVLQLSDSELQDTLASLLEKHLIQVDQHSRSSKYKHRFCNTPFGGLTLSPQERGLLCVLLLRGPQTPGELRARTGRLCEFADVNEVEQALQQLIEQALVSPLPREAGKRECRYGHCLSGEISAVSQAELAETDKATIAALTKENQILKLEVARLTAELAQYTSPNQK
ncbi:MAG: YceH family protein [Ferrimonas sp.]